MILASAQPCELLYGICTYEDALNDISLQCDRFACLLLGTLVYTHEAVIDI